jgi:DNA-binding transcriptional ArsR family regulator
VRAELPVVCAPRTDLRAPEVGQVVAFASLLADPTRAAIIAMLREGPVCVCEFAATLGERENNVSNHLARLREAGLVRRTPHEANGRFLYYELDAGAMAEARAAFERLLP